MADDIKNPDAGITISSSEQGNEITSFGKWIAGFLLVIFTLLPILALVAYWPDKLPPPNNNGNNIYQRQLFNIRLIDSDYYYEKLAATGNMPNTAQVQAPPVSTMLSAVHSRNINTIHLSTLLMILVATAGFLGTMIHTASSFTNFIGAEKFKRSWILWYVVKPFTGAGLAIVIYFVFRAGFFNFNDTSNINIYGVITLAAFAGLFTDNATMKLKEIFDVIFKPKDDRPDKMDEPQVMQLKITGVHPEKLLLDGDNNFIISGEGLDKNKLTIKINDQVVQNPVIKGDSISFSYKVPPESAAAKEFKLIVTDEAGKELFTKTLDFGELSNQ